ncbi:hypothetical protein BU15DRAFT_68433 [Melanogaster broomeanus]|nr:hypothetical protein BU15DRAFT_68433 [Melanogaster broomeanus]
MLRLRPSLAQIGSNWQLSGAAIEGEAAEDVWKWYTDTHPTIRAFKNQGWGFYDMVDAIMPSGAAQGRNALDSSFNEGDEEDQEGEGELDGSQAASQLVVPTTSQQLSTAFQQLPAAFQQLSTASQVIPATSQFIPATLKVVSTATTDSGLSVAAGPGPSKWQKSAGKASASIPSSMHEAMMTAASSQKGARGAAALTYPLLIGVTGAMSQLAGSIERSMQPPAECRAARVQSAMCVLEEQDHDLRVEVRLFLLQLFERDDYAIDVFTMIHDKDLRALWVQQKYDEHNSLSNTGGSSGPSHTPSDM